MPEPEQRSGGDLIEVDETPTSREEGDFFESAEKLASRSEAQDIAERKRYADNAYGITQAWIGFLIVLTIAQMVLKPYGLSLDNAAFITVFTTTTASIFGFWALVGQYLFRKR
jgi:hypothetical protein